MEEDIAARLVRCKCSDLELRNPIVWKVEQKDHVIATVCSCLATALTKFPYLANVTCDSKKLSFKDPE